MMHSLLLVAFLQLFGFAEGVSGSLDLEDKVVSIMTM